MLIDCIHLHRTNWHNAQTKKQSPNLSPAPPSLAIAIDQRFFRLSTKADDLFCHNREVGKHIRVLSSRMSPSILFSYRQWKGITNSGSEICGAGLPLFPHFGGRKCVASSHIGVSDLLPSPSSSETPRIRGRGAKYSSYSPRIGSSFAKSTTQTDGRLQDANRFARNTYTKCRRHLSSASLSCQNELGFHGLADFKRQSSVHFAVQQEPHTLGFDRALCWVGFEIEYTQYFL